MVRQFLTLDDKGGGGVWTHPFLADVICEQPPMNKAGTINHLDNTEHLK